MNLIKIFLTKLGFRKEPTISNDSPKPVRNVIKLKPNNFLPKEVVFFFEWDEHKEINEYLSANYERICETLSAKGMVFIYLPAILKDTSRISCDELYSFFKYMFPNINLSENELNDEFIKSFIHSNSDLSIYYKLLGESLGIPTDYPPVFLHNLDYEGFVEDNPKYIYSYNFIDENNIIERIEWYVDRVHIKKYDIEYSIVSDDELKGFSSDDLFNSSKVVSDETEAYIKKLKTLNNEKLLVSSLVYIIKSLKDVEPKIAEKINAALYNSIKEVDNKPSRLYIDKKYRIYLPDYNNIEIEMTPLPKALYLFFLKHPKGIRFKELSDYRAELTDIYCKVGNRLDMEQINKSIFDLTNIHSNSINEKCSRIKEAFVSKIDDSIAKQYYLTRGENGNKLVQLEPSLIHFEDIK